MPVSAPSASPHTLVVDDDPFIAQVIVDALREAGLHEIATVEHGQAALDWGATHPVDLLVCDLNMPVMDGIHLMRQLGTLPKPPTIILISGEDLRVLDASRQYAETQRLTVLGTLRKPITPAALAQVLQHYQPVLERPGAPDSKIRLDLAQLQAGLAGQALHLRHQPKVRLADGVLVGAEALLRWQDLAGRAVPPHEVIRAAEEARWIDPLTRAILTRAVQDRLQLKAGGLDLNMAINVSMHNLTNVALVDWIFELVQAAGDVPARYTLEVTETHLVKDLPQVLETLIRARLRGFQIAIDDYGTGAATMQLLMQLPSTELKIDRIFVAMAPLNELGRSLLKSVVELGLQLGQVITAEGIETQGQAELAQQLGCHIGQGFYFGAPMSVSQLLHWATLPRARY